MIFDFLCNSFFLSEDRVFKVRFGLLYAKKQWVITSY